MDQTTKAAPGLDDARAAELSAHGNDTTACGKCGGPTTSTHYPFGIDTRCARPFAECNWSAAIAYPPELIGSDMQDDIEHRHIADGAPDPDAWSTHDQIEWMEQQAS